MGTRGRSRHPAAHFVSRALIMLTALVALSLAACSSSGNQGPGYAASQVFVWPYVNTSAVKNSQEDVAVFDPAISTTITDASDLNMLFSGLVTLNSSTLQVEPDAAQSISVTPDGKTYTFILRNGLEFSDGSPITAGDFAYSIDRAVQPVDLQGNSILCSVDDAKTYFASQICGGPTPGSTYLKLIVGAQAKLSAPAAQAANYSLIGKGLDVVDAHTLKITISQPAAYFLEALVYPTSYVLEKSLIDQYQGGLWVDHLDQGGCSGPFKVKSYIRGKELQLVPNTNWERAWGKHLTLTEVRRPFLDSQDTEYKNYDKLGMYDYTDVPGEQYIFAFGQSDFHEVPTLTTDYFGLNFNKPPFDNPQVRQAFDLALNKQLLIDRVYNGAFIPTNHIVPDGMPGYDPQLTGPDKTQSITGNQDVAMSDMNQARANCKGLVTLQPDYCPYIVPGANQLPLPIKLLVNIVDTPANKQVATIASQTWNQVLGLNVQLDGVNDLATVVNIITAGAGNPAQVWLIGWIADYPDPQDWLSLQFYSMSGYNQSSVHDPHLDQLMNQADVDQNAAQRMSEYHTIEQDVVYLCAWIPIDQEKFSWRVRPWVQGFAFNEIQLIEDVDWANVYIQAH